MHSTALLSICAGFCPTWHAFRNDKRVKDLILRAKSVYVREIFPWLLWNNAFDCQHVCSTVWSLFLLPVFFHLCIMVFTYSKLMCIFGIPLPMRKMQKLSEGPIIQYQPFPILHIWRKYWYFLTLRIIQLIWKASQRSTCSPSLDSRQVFPHGL